MKKNIENTEIVVADCWKLDMPTSNKKPSWYDRSIRCWFDYNNKIYRFLLVTNEERCHYGNLGREFVYRLNSHDPRPKGVRWDLVPEMKEFYSQLPIKTWINPVFNSPSILIDSFYNKQGKYYGIYDDSLHNIAIIKDDKRLISEITALLESQYPFCSRVYIDQDCDNQELRSILIKKQYSLYNIPPFAKGKMERTNRKIGKAL